MNTSSPYTKWIDVSTFQAEAKHASQFSSPARSSNSADSAFSETKTWLHRKEPPSSGETFDDSHTFHIPIATDEQENPIPMLVTMSAELTVDDSGMISTPAGAIVDMSDTSGQGHKQWTRGGSQTGFYTQDIPVSISASNIVAHPGTLNIFVVEASCTVTATESGGTPPCDPCAQSCSSSGSGEGGSPSASSTFSTRGAVRGSTRPWSYYPFVTSSAGTSITASSDEYRMKWSCNFGNIRGRGAGLVGALQIFSEILTTDLGTPAALSFDHLLKAKLDIPEEGFVPHARLEIIHGARIIALRYYPDGSIRPIGLDTKGGGKASIQLHEGEECLKWQDSTGEAWLFSTTTGDLIEYSSPLGSIIRDVDDYLVVNYDSSSNTLRQIWNYWDGLAQISPSSSCSYEITLYTNAQIAGRDSDGSFTLIPDATPFKSFSIAYSTGSAESSGVLTIIESSPQRPQHPDRQNSWTRSHEGAWSQITGTGDEAICTSRTRQELEAGINGDFDVWELITETSKAAVTATRTQEIYQSTPLGKLLLTRVEGYGSPEAQTTQYRYDGVGNQTHIIAPDGSQSEYNYDLTGRLLAMTQPWGDGSYKRVTNYSYEHNEELNYREDYNRILVEIIDENGTLTDISREDYHYTAADHIKRIETRSSAMGSEHNALHITEEWLGDAPNIHARGRTRMTQAINGVQTWHDYEATSLHDALYTHSVETRVNNELIAGQSTRKVAYISAQGNTTREEEYQLLTNGIWALTSGMTHSYDVQNRRIGTQYDNGRSSSRELICNGRTLWEIDENGIRTDYAYDSARTLIETSRAATPTTPETITEWVKDAEGRALQTRTHMGALITTQSAIYDALGRMVSNTDTLGRTSTTSYSTDGLTTTQTTPSGATLITRKYPSGQVAEQSGTGQRHLSHSYAIAGSRMRHNTLISITGPTLLQEDSNGFGQNMETVSPTTHAGRYIVNSTQYNEKGQLVRSKRGSMASTLHEYDSMGNQVKQTLLLDEANPDSLTSNRIQLISYSAEQLENGIYSITTSTRYNAEGTALSSTQKTLISKTSSELESKFIAIDERGQVSSSETRYTDSLIERVSNSTVPTSDTAATATMVDGFTTAQSDHQGGSWTFTRQFLSTGILSTTTDPRGITTSTQTDIAARPIIQTDGEGNQITTSYLPCCDQPASITDALGNTVNYSYDIRNRKVAEYGTGIQPATYGYDDADRMTNLTTYRVTEGNITTDPSGRTDGDTTTWACHDATGLQLSKTFADGTQETREYNNLGLLGKINTARGKVHTYFYDVATYQVTKIDFNDSTHDQTYTYNHLGQLLTVDDNGDLHTLAYNEYSELLSNTTRNVGDGTSYSVVEQYDHLGRNIGYQLKRNGSTIHQNRYSYDNTGRIASAGFHRADGWKDFSYSYLNGTNNLTSLTHPNGIVSTRSYESNRNLLTSIVDARDSNILSNKAYSYDAIARPTTRTMNERSDTFAYNAKSELTAAQLGTDNYSYAYDNIGNRKFAQEIAEEITYATNSTNEYTSINDFTPEFDADGNQTRLQTSTGIWNIEYNAENRPTKFTSEDGSTIVEARYDYMGRRAWKKVTINGTITSFEAYIYRGYLQIAAESLLSGQGAIHFITWDPTQPTATRPLALEKHGTWYSYGLDLSKKVTELYTAEGTIATSYSYGSFGAATFEGEITSPIQWSSEIYDEELALVYYNYRHYNPVDGRWINRDPIAEGGGLNVYGFVGNRVWICDVLGNAPQVWTFSGIGDKNPYVEIYLRQHWPTYAGSHYFANSNLGTPLSSLNPFSEFEKGTLIFPMTRLNDEAERISSFILREKGSICKGNRKVKVDVVLIAPKTHKQAPDLKTCCCDINFYIVWNKADIVLNQSLFGMSESTDFWRSIAGNHKNKVIAIDTQWGYSFHAHSLPLFMTLNKNQGPNILEEIRNKYRTNSNGYLMIGHSQGTNIIMHTLSKVCKKP